MSLQKIVVHTNVFLDYVVQDHKNESVLRLAMQKFFCYTTVFNAIQLFALARTEKERRVIEDSMSAMKILGLNAKNAKKYGGWVARGMKLPRMNTLVAGICLDSKLPVLTLQPDEFRGVKELVVVKGSLVKKEKGGLEIIQESR